MNNEENRKLIGDIASDVLADVAPHEVPIFPAVSRAYFADPARAPKQRPKRDAALGFGADSLSVLLTPFVLHILSEVFEILTDAAKKAVEAGLAKEIPDVLRSMLKRFGLSGSSIPSPLGKAQLALIHERILREARRLQLPDDKVEAIANAVTTQLVIGSGR
jgi:hypothetical protein